MKPSIIPYICQRKNIKEFVLLIMFFLKAFESKSQSDSLTGENNWTLEQEKAIIITSYSSSQFPTLPKRIDLSYIMPPPGKQGKQGSCWAWATTYAIRSTMENPGKSNFFLDANGNLDSNKVFSPSYTYQYYKGDKNDCNFGNYSAKILDNLLKDGVVSLKMLPYNEKKCNFKIDQNILRAAQKNRKEGYDVIYLQDLYSAKKVLSDGHPLIIAIRIGTGFYDLRSLRNDGNNIIWKDFGRRKGDHAMVCVGYDDSLHAIKVFNSWGDNFAMNGYCYIDYNIVEQSTNYFCYPEKTVNKFDFTLKENQKEQGQNSETNAFNPSVNSWFKEGYYRRFKNLKIVLSELNASKGFAVIEIRNEDYDLLQSFFVQKGTSKNFYLSNEKYIFTLTDIKSKGWNIFKQAAYFNIKIATPD